MTIKLPVMGGIEPPEIGETQGCIQCQAGSKLVLFVIGYVAFHFLKSQNYLVIYGISTNLKVQYIVNEVNDWD